ncbi:hypothetical protein EUGRSUZ_H02769 [Eucalyptus grandis]|uniref:Uncharacterized protein n=2 Tax=Eucalyptus grandis TaxID=71139 RepID=A0ACC3JTW1_EUCGR|nr:hypothetical protein EUGRSUZ_H02769 [Eucalyptus grandis]
MFGKCYIEQFKINGKQRNTSLYFRIQITILPENNILRVTAQSFLMLAYLIILAIIQIAKVGCKRPNYGNKCNI